MPRQRRQVYPGVAHHITHRGILQMPVFLNDGDYYAYKAMIHKYSTRYDIDVFAYALMTTHIHLVAVPPNEDALSLMMHDLQTAYTSRFNQRTPRTGVLWDGRFYSCALDEIHCWEAIRYVERNPVRAGLVSVAEEYRWSSAAAHCGLIHDPLLSALPELFPGIPDWSAWLRGEDAILTTELRRHTMTGIPFSRILKIE